MTLVLTAMVVVLVATGCPKKKGATVDTDAPPPVRPPAQEAPPPADTEVRQDPWDDARPTTEAIPEPEPSGRLATIYFDYDSSELTPTAIATLRENAQWLKGRDPVVVAVEGHCDERGTIEYNLALGERRAKEVRDYLVTLGIGRDRVRIVSYGEERPARPGHDESAWSQNRRAEFVVGE
jgi:peptidoglycan-associated lipoprotein